MTAAALLKDIRAQLKAAADPEFEAGLRWFFKEPVTPYGVRTPLLRELARIAYAQIRHWPVAERDRFVTDLWKRLMELGTVEISHSQLTRVVNNSANKLDVGLLEGLATVFDCPIPDLFER